MMMHLFLPLALLHCIWASPTPHPPRLSIFDDPSIPIVDPSELGLSDQALEARGLGVEKRDINITVIAYGVSLQMELPVVTCRAYITDQVPTPMTQNGANPVDLVISCDDDRFRFLTNGYLNRLPGVAGARTPPLDVAKVWIKADGTIEATVDPAVPVTNPPLSMFTYLPAYRYYVTDGGVRLLAGNKTLTGQIIMAGKSWPTGSASRGGWGFDTFIVDFKGNMLGKSTIRF